ncbi:hypothetical protein HEP87_28420 [Streptomyces sp. S1D4-11]|nr:hypothetical protein [Streptomyces sp. S1D4-11]QIY92906.1 hypothetical protein HEP87_28420 [Streptomyces sp. S1D4-11]
MLHGTGHVFTETGRDFVRLRRGHRRDLLDPPTPSEARGRKREETRRSTG